MISQHHYYIRTRAAAQLSFFINFFKFYLFF